MTLTVNVGFLRRSCLAAILFSALFSACLLFHDNHHVEPTPKTTTPGTALVTSQDGRRTSLLAEEDHYVVPNVVHFVWFGQYEKLRFHHMLSILSSSKIIQPERILFHCDHEPVGHWWAYIKTQAKNMTIIKRQPPSEIYGKEIIKPEHKSDIARMDILLESGGIYMDLDVIALKSFDKLRRYNMTMGIEYHGTPGRLNNGIIVANKDAQFLKIWRETYRTFTKREWDYHDSVIPYSLQFQYPDLIHVEEKTLNYPSGKDLHLIFKERYDWSRNFAIHLWYRLYEFEHNQVGIRTMNTTYGEVARYIFYGSPKIFTP